MSLAQALSYYLITIDYESETLISSSSRVAIFGPSYTENK